MKSIKESKSVSYTESVHPVVEQMEKEWPEMTKEFKKYNVNNMSCSYINNTIMVLVIFQLGLCYKHQMR